MTKNYDEKTTTKHDPEVLEVHGDSIEVNITVKYDPKFLNRKTVIKYEPTISYGDEKEKPLKVHYVLADKAETDKKGPVINSKEGGSVTMSDKIPFEDGMKTAELKSYNTIQLSNKYDELAQCNDVSDSITVGTITTSLSVKPLDDILMGGFSSGDPEDEGDMKKAGAGSQKVAPSNYTPQYGTDKVGGSPSIMKAESADQEATIYFVIDRYDLRASERNKPEITRLWDFARENNTEIDQVVIESYASPDGELERNTRLSKRRAETAYDYFKRELKKAGVDNVADSAFYSKSSRDEDWNGFAELIKKSDLSDKRAILDIVNSNISLEKKEDNIRKLESWDKFIVDSILPELRRSEITLRAHYVIRSLDSIKAIAARDGMEKLTQKELIILANDAENADRKREVYEHYTERYPDDWVGFNNHAATLLFEGMFEEAKEALESAHEKFPKNDTIAFNLGVAYRFLQQYDDAREKYERARTKGRIDARNNVGILDIKVGDYASSVETFEGDRCDYNVALAMTLNGNYDEAISKIECIEEKNEDDFYLRAIAAARKGDIDLMTTSLTRAVEMNADYRDKAKKDLEFRKYFDAREFQNALR